MHHHVTDYLPGSIAQSQSTDRTCEIGAMTEGIIPFADQKKTLNCICLDMLITSQRSSKFQRSIKTTIIRQNDVTLQGLRCSGLVAIALLKCIC